MALVTVDNPSPLESQANGDKLEEPDLPKVIYPPCDPWPRPYYLENGLRRVTPYHYTYNTYCKQRWRDRELWNVFVEEFRDRTPEYYKDAIRRGLVQLNGKDSDLTTVIKNGDLISHTCHRHEPPVTAQPIGIVHEDDDMMVINKPAGVPVHPAGRYNYNCLTEIIQADRGIGFKAHPCNRLDRLTSGIMFMGKNRPASDKMADQLRVRTVRKEYVARVVGDFPDGDVVCEQPILSISPKLGLNRVRADGKEARTVFRKMAYYPPTAEDVDRDQKKEGNSDRPATPVDDGMPWKRRKGYSIVRCLPLTGRTHQLRVHLQFLGHPISNDPIYANQRVFGQYLGKGDGSAEHDEDIISRLSKMGKTEVAEAVAYHEEMVDEYHKRKAEKETGEVCEICDTPLYSDPGPHELGIYLHAKRYWCVDGGWDYQTPLPEWALPPAGMSGPTEATPESDPLAADLAKLGLEKESASASASA